MEGHKYRMSKKLVSTIGLKESISRLPEEIQAFILSKLDGNSAAVAKRVCKLWNELLTGTYEPRREKASLLYANSKGTDQPGYRLEHDIFFKTTRLDVTKVN